MRLSRAQLRAPNRRHSASARPCGSGSGPCKANRRQAARLPVVFLILLVFWAAGKFATARASGPKTPEQVQDSVMNALEDRKIEAVVGAKESIKQMLKVPESADFSDVTGHVDGKTVLACGWVNAKNGFGGYTGRTPFIGGPGGATIKENDNADTFRELWNRVCTH